MSVPTLKRTVSIFVLLFAATSVLAGPPSARTGSRAAYDESDGVIVMFGGLTNPDAATGQQYSLDETYVWDGTRWIRRFPEVSPAPRAIHAMTYDSVREQVVLFGGRTGPTTDLADTWVFKDGQWSEIETSNAPEKRSVAGLAFDPSRGVSVLFGGQKLNDDASALVNLFDMWEFDGSDWTRIMEQGPEVLKPTLVFDEARNQLLMLGVNSTSDTLMYAYDAEAKAWNKLEPEKLPVCANDISVIYHNAEQKVFLVGGQCPKEGVGSTEELYTWDGTNWTLVETVTKLARGVNRAIAYDKGRDVVVMFGGAFSFTTSPRASTNAFSFGNWSFVSDFSSPGPRSLAGMSTDTAQGIIYLTSGLTDSDFFSDFWKFQDGFWQQLTIENAPLCAQPLTAFDSNRGKLVFLCSDSALYEFDGAAWKKIENLRTSPAARRFAAMVYDENITKVVLFGGYEEREQNYSSRTWTWDGTTWVEVRRRRPHLRALHAMWYDPILRRTVIYGGIGRKNSDARLERFNDMWSFNGTEWTELKPSTLPPTRYGAYVAVNPESGKTLLFGGLRVDTGADGLQKQLYTNDTWEWDGTTWRQLNPDGAPSPRENGVMAWDPAGKRFILFGGWSGYYHGDTWAYDPARNTWRVFAE